MKIIITNNNSSPYRLIPWNRQGQEVTSSSSSSSPLDPCSSSIPSLSSSPSSYLFLLFLVLVIFASFFVVSLPCPCWLLSLQRVDQRATEGPRSAPLVLRRENLIKRAAECLHAPIIMLEIILIITNYYAKAYHMQ